MRPMHPMGRLNVACHAQLIATDMSHIQPISASDKLSDLDFLHIYELVMRAWQFLPANDAQIQQLILPDVWKH
eukprot:scaffold5787_cov32-Prasinocladus_malaysianus.AAC.2